MTRLSLYVAMSGAILATSALAASDKGCANSNGKAEGCPTKDEQTATSEVRVDAYLNAELTDGKGFSAVTMSTDEGGNVGNGNFSRGFRIASNADHEVQIWYDAISVTNSKGDTCVPVFDAEGGGSGGSVAGEADVIGGSIVLKVDTKEIFSASAGENLDGASQSAGSGVSVVCGTSETTVDRAVVTVKNDVDSTFSREYTLDVTAFGKNGSIVFDGGSAINAGNAPAGQYDNDILIAAGTLNNYTYEAQNDAYASAEFGTTTEYYDVE